MLWETTDSDCSAGIVPAVKLLLRSLVTIGLATVAPCQILEELRQQLREDATAVRYGTFINFLANTAADGQLSSGSLQIDTDPKTQLTSISLPFRNEIRRDDEKCQLFGEATLGYATAHSRFSDLWAGRLPGLETSAD